MEKELKTYNGLEHTSLRKTELIRGLSKRERRMGVEFFHQWHGLEKGCTPKADLF